MLNLTKQLIANGYVILEQGEHIFDQVAVDRMNWIISQVIDSYNNVAKGDASEQHQLKVCRFRYDSGYPEDLHPLAEKVFKIINNKKANQFYQQVTALTGCCIRQCQLNRLEKDDYVGYHTDVGDLNKGSTKTHRTHRDYKFTAIWHLNSEYTGGDTVLYLANNQKKHITLPENSMLIIRSEMPHLIEKICSGQRDTLVYFLSDNFGMSQEKQLEGNL